MGGRYVVGAASVAELQRMAAAARELAGDGGRVDAVAVAAQDGALLAPGGAAPDELAARLAGLADALVVYEGMGAWLRGDFWAAALGDALGDDAGGLLVADGPGAREAAARVAAARGASLVSMCDAVERAADGTLSARRQIYGGVAEGTISLPVAPAVCLFAAGVFDGESNGAPVPLERRRLEPPRHQITHVGDEPVVKTVDLAGAAVVVSVGRGFAKAEDIAMVEPLVQRLGAELGCSRPIAEDFKWLPKERLVGLTGTSVSAGLYLALGISGQVQHLTGIKGARVVVAVNNDAKAPIVRNADYVIVDDLYKVVPELVAALGAGS
jgi:electron transfer flavoprotein alpha subunit